MSQQVSVERDLVFKGAAAHTSNVEGNICFDKHVYFNDFDGAAVDETHDIDVNEAHGGTGAIAAIDNGAYRLASSTTDNDKAEAATGLYWKARNNCVMEARVKVDNVDTVGINVGFSDAPEEANDQIAFEINVATVTDRCSNGVCFAYDTDATTKRWYIVNTKADAEGGTLTSFTPAADTYEVFRIELDASGNATYYRNGVAVGYKVNAVTATTALTPYVAVISRAGTAARNLDIDYIKCWQDRY